MKMKRIMSMLLAGTMLFACLGGFFGFSVPTLAADEDTEEVLKTYEIATAGALKNSYSTLADKVAAETASGYTKLLAASGNYQIYCNIYTGEVYYYNTVARQYVSTNPASLAGVSKSGTERQKALSQLKVKYMDMTGTVSEMFSFNEAAERGQISVKQIRNGIRVEYTIGRTDTNYLMPGWITRARFESLILTPIEEYILNYFANSSGKTLEEVLVVYQDYFEEKGIDYDARHGMTAYNAMKAIAEEEYYLDEEKAFVVASFQYSKLYNTYALIDPNTAKPEIAQQYKAKYKICAQIDPETGINYAIYVVGEDLPDKTKKLLESYVKTYCGETYNYDEKAKDTELTGYVSTDAAPAYFRMSLEYTIGADGTLSVSLPANGIRYDSANFTLLSLDMLQYLGAGNMNNDGYAFYPDGSGALLEFDELRKQSAGSLTNKVYGTDFAYYSITAKHQEEIRVPVYGIVDKQTLKSDTINKYVDETGKIQEEKVTTTTVNSTGYVAYLTEGEALSSLTVAFGGGSAHNFALVYPTFTPEPSDSYTLDGSLSVSSSTSSSWTVVTEKKYLGNFSMNICMLGDTVPAVAAGFEDASWIGMAKVYRDYIWNGKTSFTSDDVADSLPLYIESFGTVETTDKVLSVPVTVNKPLTTFTDVIAMYEELSTYKTTHMAAYKEKAEQAEANAEAAKAKGDYTNAEKYEAEAKKYRELAENISDIVNINFKLTGFTNGGLISTYPAKVNWMKEVGGLTGFNDLLAYADSLEIGSLGVYPDFEFSYSTVTKMFDGTSLKNDAARTVDNRYASMQVYDCVYQQFTSYFDIAFAPDAIARHYEKFAVSYAKAEGIIGISAGSLGADLNSSFYEDNPQNREDAKETISGVIGSMKEDFGSVMVAGGNVFAATQVDHIIDLPLDSSNYKYMTRAVPFIGMLLHGYVNYAGAAMNEAGDTDYLLLKSIENGASLYYILSYANTALLKDDLLLSHYYSIRYDIWVEDLVQQYTALNNTIGDLQTYKINDEILITAERIPDSLELQRYRDSLKNLTVSAVEKAILDASETTTHDLRFQIVAKRFFENENLIEVAKADYDVRLKEAEDHLALLNSADSPDLADVKAAEDSLATLRELIVDPANPTLSEQRALAAAELKLEAAVKKQAYNLSVAADLVAYLEKTAEDVYQTEALIDSLINVLTSSWGDVTKAQRAILSEMLATYMAGGTWESTVGKTLTVSVDYDAVCAQVLSTFAPALDRFDAKVAVEFTEILKESIADTIAAYYAPYVNKFVETLTYTTDNDGNTVYESLTPYEYGALTSALAYFYVAKAEVATAESVKAHVREYLNNVNGNKDVLTVYQNNIIDDVMTYLAGNGFTGDIVATVDTIDLDKFESIYTDSETDDSEYVKTPYTIFDASVVMIVYEDEISGDRVGIILNYNVFDITVRFNGAVYNIESYGFQRVELD